jgi:MFS family permease
MLAINISAAFMAVFLYQNGYSIQFIAGYWVFYFVLKIILSFPAAKYTARFGPKHGILLSNLLFIPAIVAFTFVPDWGIAAMAVTAVLQATSVTLYSVCYLVDFSKVKSIDHAGKEIAYMNIIEKIAAGLSPLVGGILAFIAGPRATLWTAAVLFALASVPLFRTSEPTKTGQKLVFRDFPWRLTIRSYTAEVGIGFDAVASGGVWMLMVAVVILGVDGNQVYAQLGALLSVVLLAALAASYMYGKLIDRRRGGELLKAAVVANSLVHLSRPFVTSPVIVAGVNIANEAVTTGYAMAFTRGMFDMADISGHRITYLMGIEMMLNVGAALAGAVLIGFIYIFGTLDGMKYFFFMAAAISLLVATPKFPLYRK